MRVNLHAALAFLLVAGCGGPPATQPPKQEVVVADGQDVPEEDGPGTSDTPAPALTRSGGDVESCARGLRDGEGIPKPDGKDLYDRGMAAERASDLTTARKSFYELIQNHPRSGLIPLAYLAFGEIFRAEAAADPSKYPLAEQSYSEVSKYPPPDNTAYGYTMLRLGDVHTATSDHQRALNDYKKAIDAGRQYPNLPCGQVIAEDAKNKLTKGYAEVGDPAKAYVFFRAIAGDEGAKTMMEQLVAIYRDQKKSAEACSAVRSTPSLGDLVNEYCKKP